MLRIEFMNMLTVLMYLSILFLGIILSLSQAPTKIRTVAMFLFFDLDLIFHIEFLDIYMVYLHTKFHTINSITSLAITIKPKSKHKYHAARRIFVLY
jgi:hypothetical protein